MNLMSLMNLMIRLIRNIIFMRNIDQSACFLAVCELCVYKV